MSGQRKRLRIVWVLEVLFFAAALAAGIIIALLGRCIWEPILLAVWAVILLVLGILLLKNERRLDRRLREEEHRYDGR